MRISQLIEFLTKAQSEHGDIFVENADGIVVTARVEQPTEGTDLVVVIE
jgi:hypothetical protein